MSEPIDDPDVLVGRGESLPGILGTLFEKLMGCSGGWPDEWTREKWDAWFSDARIPAVELRNWLRDVAFDYGIDWLDMQLHPDQAEALGLTDPFECEARGGTDG